ncbi:MAG: lipid kinase YegS [Myxococcota bacterium]
MTGQNRTRIVLHGKQATNQSVVDAVRVLREEGFELDVRVTWEAGDATRLTREALSSGVRRVVAGGGDGTVNEVLNGVLEDGTGAELAVLPLGTANDFARSAGISLQTEDALRLAVTGSAQPTDVGEAGGRSFLNVATGGFGTEITVGTDPRLKKSLGSAAYLITGVTQFSSIRPVECALTAPGVQWAGKALVLAVGNGRQAGGGHVLCPSALVDDGHFEVTVLPDMSHLPFGEQVEALLSKGRQALEDTVLSWRVPEVEISSDDGLHFNLDGEPVQAKTHRFRVIPDAVALVLPSDSPLRSDFK